MRASPDHRPCGRLLHPLARRPVHPADHGPTRPLARPAAALMLLATLAACTPGAHEGAAVAAARPATQPATAALGVPPATAAALPARWRVNALYVSVIDDDEPPRWAAPDRAGQCGPDTTLHVDGAPMREGARIPGPVFRLTWRIDHCQPLGDAGPLLSGRYELLVMHDDEHGAGAVLLAHDPFDGPASSIASAANRSGPMHADAQPAAVALTAGAAR